MKQRIADCHAHLIDPVRFPLSAGKGYKPKPEETGTCEQFCDLLDQHGVTCALLVQLSGYGTDNSILLDAMSARPGRFKTIAVVEMDTPERELERLSDAGVVGVRFNLVSYDPGHLFRPETKQFLARLKSLGWVAQVFADDAQWADAAALLRASGVRVVVDHLGVSRPESIRGPGFAAVCALAQDGIAAIKLSAPFRISRTRPSYDDLDPVIGMLLTRVGADSLMWGSDWPFPAVSPRLSYADALAPLARWLTSDDDREKVLWRTPARLFGFEELPA
jgi:predicted TIM-barrel fold metal-dependent hydrolase